MLTLAKCLHWCLLKVSPCYIIQTRPCKLDKRSWLRKGLKVSLIKDMPGVTRGVSKERREVWSMRERWQACKAAVLFLQNASGWLFSGHIDKMNKDFIFYRAQSIYTYIILSNVFPSLFLQLLKKNDCENRKCVVLLPCQHVMPQRKRR